MSLVKNRSRAISESAKTDIFYAAKPHLLACSNKKCFASEFLADASSEKYFPSAYVGGFSKRI